MITLKSKLPEVSTTIFTIMSKMAADYGAINLSQGFPNFESDPILVEAVAKAMRDGYNQYAPMGGYPALRDVVSKKVRSLYGRNYDPISEVTITAGATQAIFTAMAATVHPGDEVIIFTPAYDCYGPSIELFGGKTVEVQLSNPGFRPNWQEVAAAINPNTRMIVINSPHNPSGGILTAEDMKELETLVVNNDLLVISDEVYEHIIFDGIQHESAARYDSLADRTFIVASFGKTFHNTGWKMGYCLAPEHLSVEFRKVHQYNVFCVNHPVQRGLAEYLQQPERYLSLPAFYQQKRDLFLAAISGSRFRVIPSSGTYFQLLDYTDITDEGDREFAERLTREHGLATIPVSVFNKDKADHKQLRVCFAKTDDTLYEAAEIINSI